MIVSVYYTVIFLVDALLSIIGKNSVLLLPAVISILTAMLYASSDCYGERWRKISTCLCFILGGAVAIYGTAASLLSPLPLLEHTVILTQGICGLLVTVADPVIERLKAEE